MRKPELLAPAGNMESLHAAIMAGCDAVYIGGKLFGARTFALNFSNEELKEAVDYAHLYGVKVYVTVNTLIYESEVNALLEYMKYLHKIGVDAVIMQDIGMIDLVRKVLPNMEIHASTQLHIHNLDGAKLVESMGLKRTVLARETSIDEIKHIKENTNIELEIFVHGALCISYSGQCLMSSLIGGRSGNRGACAGSCRLQYDLVDENDKKINKDKYLLSTKDLNSLERIGSLIDIGVESFKIEGRMKRPEYVYMVVSLYRKAIDSYLKKRKVEITEKDIFNLKKIFNREFTKGFLFNENNNDLVNQFRPNHLGLSIGKVINIKNKMVTVKLTSDLSMGDGIRILGEHDTGLTLTSMFKNHQKVTTANKNDIVSFKIDDEVKINSEVLKTTDKKELENIEKLIKSNSRKVDIKGQIKLRIGEPITLKFKDDTHVIKVEYGIVEEAKTNPITRDKVSEQISKLGNTVYNLSDLIIKMDSNVFVNIKDLNEIRRQAVELLNEQRLQPRKYVEGKYTIEVPDFDKEKNINIKVPNKEIYEKIKNDNYKYIYTDTKDLLDIDDPRIIYMLPRVMNNYPEYNKSVQVEELGGITKYDNYTTGAFLNVVNSYSLAFLHGRGSKKVTLSYELTYDRVEDIIDAYTKRYNKHPNTEVIVYGNEEAMISKFNLLKKFNVSGKYNLKDRFSNKYPIRIKDDKMIIYNYLPRNYKDNYFDIGVNNIRIDILNNKQLKDEKPATKY